MSSIRISKRNMDPWILFILQYLTDHILQLDIRPDRKLSHAIAVLVRMRVSPKVILQFLIGRVRLHHPIPFNGNRQWILFQIAKLGTQIIADNSIDDKRSIDFTRSSKYLTARKITPLIAAD